MTEYSVTLRFQFPSWDERDGITYHNVLASTKAMAIKAVRRMAQRDGHTGCGGGSGRVSFKAEATP